MECLYIWTLQHIEVMATIQEKKLYLVTLSFFKIYDRPTGKYVSLPPPPARFFFNFRKRTYPLWLDVIQNAWHCKLTAIDFQGKWVAFEESQNRTILYSRIFFLGENAIWKYGTAVYATGLR